VSFKGKPKKKEVQKPLFATKNKKTIKSKNVQKYENLNSNNSIEDDPVELQGHSNLLNKIGKRNLIKSKPEEQPTEIRNSHEFSRTNYQSGVPSGQKAPISIINGAKIKKPAASQIPVKNQRAPETF
jgi:hypothetical protein